MNAKTVDFHVHVVHDELAELAAGQVVINGFGARKPAPRPPGSRRHANFQLMLDPTAHIDAMNNRGADIHVLATSSVLQSTAWADAASDLRYCRMMNDRMAEWVAHAPHRFIGSMVLPLQDIRASLDELARCVKQHSFKIVHAPASVKGVYLGDSYFEEYWDSTVQFGALTYIHPEGVGDPWFQNFGLWNSIGQPIEETKVMSSLIYGGTFDRFPAVEIAISHGGGYLPHYIGRLDRNVTNMPDSTRNISRMPSDYLKMFHYDTCVYDATTLDRLVSVVGADRIILGSDFPFGESDPCEIVAGSQLSDNHKREITGHNALALLRKIGAA